jgi:hypothetical protein
MPHGGNKESSPDFVRRDPPRLVSRFDHDYDVLSGVEGVECRAPAIELIAEDQDKVATGHGPDPRDLRRQRSEQKRTSSQQLRQRLRQLNGRRHVAQRFVGRWGFLCAIVEQIGLAAV